MDDKKEQLKRLQQDIEKLVLWKTPLRSGAYFVLLLSVLILSKSYSVIQIVSAILTISIGINLIYVNVTIQTQRILADRQGINPFHTLLQDNEITTIDRGFLKRTTEMVADVTEAFLQWVSRIVLIENNAYSAKWMGIFYIVWKLSAIISVRTLVTLLTLLLFSVPLLYSYNKTFVDARIQQVRSVCQTHLEQGQHQLEHGWHKFCSNFKLSPSDTVPADLPPKPSGSRKVD
ncbi:Reticulon-domain-containing protein [Chlamydoabsidia padenii]|nr:Reticulon-domain-containing protein [Chlamydoabsidia padenii]